MAVKTNLKSFGQLVDVKALVQLAATDAIGRIQRRTAKGTDMHGRAFRSYSDEYAKKRDDDGRNASPVDLTFTGGLLASVRILRVVDRVGKIAALIGPGTGTSPEIGWRKTGGSGAYKSHRTGRRGPSHNLVGRWLHEGRTRGQARPWLGLSEADRRAVIARAVQAARRMVARLPKVGPSRP
jgi:hypothetical protein